MIVVTGTTGQLGRLIVEKLLDRLPPDRVGASARDPARAADLLARGVRVRRGDFADPASLPHAFEGATQLPIVSSNASSQGGDPLAQHRGAIDAARTVGVRRIIYTSHMAASRTSAFPPMLDHAAAEDMLRASGFAWTALRNGFYASSALALMGERWRDGVIEAPADGKVAWTTHGDLAEAAAATLADEGRYDGPTPPLTGAAALNLADLASTASNLLGRPVRRDVIADEELQSRMAARGAPDAVARITLGLYVAARAGEFAPADPTLERLLGRPPKTMREVIADQLNR